MSRSEVRDGSFSPGSENRLSERFPSFPDAADGLFRGDELSPQASGFGLLLTADGGRYEGELFGAKGIGEGELVLAPLMTSKRKWNSLFCLQSSDIALQ